MSMKYYFYVSGDTIGSLRRVNMESDPIILERWDGEKWVFSPDTIGVTGLASDADEYKEVSKKDAEKYMKSSRST